MQYMSSLREELDSLPFKWIGWREKYVIFPLERGKIESLSLREDNLADFSGEKQGKFLTD